MPWNRKVAFGSPLSPLMKAIVAFRLNLQDLLRHDAADADIVEGDVERVRILELDVIGDRLDAGVVDCLDRRQDGVGIEGHDEDDVDLLRDQAFDVGSLLLRRTLCVGGDIGVTGSLDGSLDGGFVGLPALFLERLPRYGDRLARCLGNGAQRHGHGYARQNGGCKLLHDFLPCAAWALSSNPVMKLFFSSFEKKSGPTAHRCQHRFNISRIFSTLEIKNDSACTHLALFSKTPSTTPAKTMERLRRPGGSTWKNVGRNPPRRFASP